MRDAGRTIPLDCAAARETIHARLDGDDVESRRADELRSHLAGCSDCRAFDTDLRALGEALRTAPQLTLPDEALAAVWQETVNEPGARRGQGVLRPLLAAAAVLAMILLGVWQLQRPVGPPAPTRAEVLQAADEVRMVLALTSRELRRAERTAMKEVLAGEISPALQQVPVRWPSPQRRGTGT